MIRKAGLFTSAIIQYFRIRSRNKSQLQQNDLSEICRKRPFVMAQNEKELLFVMKYLRPFARRIAPHNLCLDISLVLINMSAIPAQIHFSVKKQAYDYSGHAWIEAADTLFSTDYEYDQDSIWSWEKPANVF